MLVLSLAMRLEFRVYPEPAKRVRDPYNLQKTQGHLLVARGFALLLSLRSRFSSFPHHLLFLCVEDPGDRVLPIAICQLLPIGKLLAPDHPGAAIH